MDIKIIPAHLHGEITAISSKSDAHRLLIAACLSDNGGIVVTNCLSNDILATVSCLRSLGSKIDIQTQSDNISEISVSPVNAPKHPVLDCNESGTTARFLLPIAASLCDKVTLTGKGKLPTRPFMPLVSQMQANGCDFSSSTLPLTVTNRLKSGEFVLDGDVSSQFISGLLFALPLLKGDSSIKINGTLQSRGYVDMTIDSLSRFGVNISTVGDGFLVSAYNHYHAPPRVTAQGDWSNSAFWLCAGAIGDKVTVTGISELSLQKDREIAGILARFGAKITQNSSEVTVVQKSLTATRIDAGEIPDLVPVLAAVAAVSSGTTIIHNAKRLKYKESDRLFTTSTALNALGADITVTEDSLIINGKKSLVGGVCDSFNDHRIAMAAAVASCVCEGEVILTNADAVNKSYPNFFGDFNSLGGCANVI